MNAMRLAQGFVMGLLLVCSTAGQATEDVDCAGCVDSADIANQAVTGRKLANFAVTSVKLGSRAVTTRTLASHAVARNKIADGAVTTAKIRDSAVTMEKLAPELSAVLSGSAQVLDLSELPVVISKPGYYVLNQDWEIFGGIPVVGPPIISITSENITLDLRGFAIKVETQRRLLEITRGNVQLRNGTLTNVEADEAPIVGSSGVTLDNVTVGGRAGINLGINSVVRNSDISGWLSVGDGSTVRDNTITCSFDCVTGGSGTRIIGNEIKAVSQGAFPRGGQAIRIRSGSTVRHNEVRLLIPGQDTVGIGAYGDANFISSNVLIVEDGAVGIIVDGDRNHLDSNVLLRTFEPGPQFGIEFRKDGNFYGDNRMSATVPFELGGTVQTDWGGNVGF